MAAGTATAHRNRGEWLEDAKEKNVMVTMITNDKEMQDLLAVLIRIALALEREDYHSSHIVVMARIAIALERIGDVMNGSG
jgi:hypothetical protein